MSSLKDTSPVSKKPSPLQEISPNLTPSSSHEMRTKFVTFRREKLSDQQTTSKNVMVASDAKDLDFSKLQKLYKQATVRINELALECEHLETSLVSKDQLLSSQAVQIKAAQNMAKRCKQTVHDELGYYESDHKVWLAEKKQYEAKIIQLQKALNTSLGAANTESGDSDQNTVAILFAENEKLKARLSLYKHHNSAIKQKQPLVASEASTDELLKIRKQNEEYRDTIKSLKSDLDEAAKSFTELNDSMSFHEDLEEQGDSDESVHEKANNTLDKELSSISTQYSSISNDFKLLEQQYKIQQNVLSNLRLENEAVQHENSQLYDLFNCLCEDMTVREKVKGLYQEQQLLGSDMVDHLLLDLHPAEDSQTDKSKFRLPHLLKRSNKSRSVSYATAADGTNATKHHSNFRYFKKNNRTSRVISNNVDSSFSLEQNDKRLAISNSAANKADQSLVFNLKPLKISKHSRPNNHEESDSSNDALNPANVSLNASIDIKNFQKAKFSKTFKKEEEIKETSAEDILEEDDIQSIDSAVPFDHAGVDISVIHNRNLEEVDLSKDLKDALEESSVIEESSFLEGDHYNQEYSSFMIPSGNLVRINSLISQFKGSMNMDPKNLSPMMRYLLLREQRDDQKLLTYDFAVDVD